MGMKPSDIYCVPLCVECHAKQHAISEKYFWGELLEAAKQTAQQLYAVTGNWSKGCEIICNFGRVK